jgi:hypothetical protein
MAEIAKMAKTWIYLVSSVGSLVRDIRKLSTPQSLMVVSWGSSTGFCDIIMSVVKVSLLRLCEGSAFTETSVVGACMDITEIEDKSTKHSVDQKHYCV